MGNRRGARRRSGTDVGRRSTPPQPPAAARPVKGPRFLLVALAAVAGFVVLAAVLAYVRTRPAETPPNVLLITIDTLRWDHVGCYGDHEAATPALDALAARGVRFPLAVAHVPLTLPSHASILTGLTPLRHGVRNNADSALGTTMRTLAEQFRDAGFDTAAFVSGFPVHSRFGLARGFAVYDDRFPRGDDPARPPYIERRGDQTVAAAVAWLDRRPRGAPPFFLWLHLFDPHAPYDPPEPFRSRFSAHPYDGEVAFADQQVGVLFDRLKQAGLLDRTLVLATADHGEGLGEHAEPTHGLFIYDSTIRVPFVLAGPGVPAGRTPTTLARGIDVAPTLLDLARVAALPGVDGRSLQPAWSRPGARDEPAYVESLFARLSFGWAPLHGWREGQVLFIDAPRPELYDAAVDPTETHDLAPARPAEAGRYQRLVRAAAASAAPVQLTSSSAETRERLRSLGYTGGAGAIPNPSLRDPKDFAALAVRIENATTIERSDPAKAAAEFRAALKEDAANPLARRHLAIALSNLKRFDEALAETRALVDSGAATAETLLFMGDCLRLAGRFDEALAAYAEAARLDPRMPEPGDGEGKTLIAMGRRDEARQAFERVLRLAGDDPDALGGLADLAIERGDLNDARARLEALRARDAEDRSSARKLGVVLVRMGDLDAAVALFGAILARDPGDAEAALDLGGALAKAGRAAEAVPLFERAIAAGTRSPVVYNSLGFARLEGGNEAGAAEALRASLRLKPDQPDIVDALRKLEGR
jgi:choline-sulfatase